MWPWETTFCMMMMIAFIYIWRFSPLSRADSLHSHVIRHEWIAFYSTFFEYPPKWCTYSTGMAGATRNCCRLGASSVYTIQPCTISLHANHIRKVYACLAVTCHLRFWQNDWGLLCATAVTQEWNEYQNKSQHRKLTREKKILLPLQQGFEPATFWSWVRRSNNWAIPCWTESVPKQCHVWSCFWPGPSTASIPFQPPEILSLSQEWLLLHPLCWQPN